jgi:hypothetical protein
MEDNLTEETCNFLCLLVFILWMLGKYYDFHYKQYDSIYIYKQGTVSIPIFLKPSQHEPLGPCLNKTLIALFWTINMLFTDEDEPQKIIP